MASKTVKGMSDTQVYRAWVNMKCWCKRNNIQYIAYWEDFDNFWLSMRSTYTTDAILSFKDNGSGVYSYNTCYWKHKNKDLRKPIHHKGNATGVKGMSVYVDAKGNKYYWCRVKGLPYKMFSFKVLGEQKAYLEASQYIRKFQGY